VTTLDEDGLLTPTEHTAIRLAGELWNAVCDATGHGPTRSADLWEVASHIHAIQNAVMANAAARAYPGEYRLLGGSHGGISSPRQQSTVDPVSTCAPER
jgi:hypothetical protein